MKKFTISASIFNWTVEITDFQIFLTAEFHEEDAAPFERVPSYMNLPMPIISKSGINAMIEFREEFEKGNHYAIPNSYLGLPHNERMAIDAWRELAIREYQEDATFEW